MARIIGLRFVIASLLVSCGATPTPSKGVTLDPLPPTPPASAPSKPIALAHPSPDGVVHIGKTLRFADCEWVIIEARDAGKEVHANTDHADDPMKTTVGRFILVHYRITNLGKKEEMILDRPKILDAAGRRFGPIEMEAWYVPPNAKTIGLEMIEPSLPREFWTAIEVAPDATKLAFEFGGFSLLSAKETVDLGL